MNPGFPPPGSDGANHLWEMVRSANLDEPGTLFLLFNMPDFVEDEDFNIAKKNYPHVIRNVVLASIAGLTLNIQLKRIPNFLRWNRFLRLGLRVPTFFLPFGVIYPSTQARVNELRRPLQKYQKRFLNFQKTGDFKYLDPEFKLAKRFNEKMGG